MPTRRCMQILLGELLSVLLWTTVAKAQVPEQFVDLNGETLSSSRDVKVLPAVRWSTIAVSHDGAMLGTATDTGRICVWRTTTGSPIRCFQTAGPAEKTTAVTALTFDPSDDWLIAGDSGGSVSSWSMKAGANQPPCGSQSLSDQQPLGRATLALPFIPATNSVMVVPAHNGAIRSCRQPSQKPLPALADFPGSLFDQAAVDARGELIAVGKGELLGVWQLQSGAKLWMEPKVGSPLQALALSGSGAQLVTGHSD